MKYKRIGQMRVFILVGIVVILTMLNIGSAYAAGIVTTNISTITPTNLVNNLLTVGGGGITVTKVNVTGADVSMGTFSGGTGIIGFESGIILSSGDIKNVIGPNNENGITGINSKPGDTDLDKLIPGYKTFDASVLEFDFIPLTNQLQFRYVFSSDEYNEFVGSNYNDVFGFFVNGKNIAMIPGTATPVSINNVNCGKPYDNTKCTSGTNYINNEVSSSGAPLNTEMDGLTKVFTATANVIADKPNHIKIAIADAGDSVLDSNVFIEAGSFASPQLKLSPESSTNNVGEIHTLTATLLDGTGAPVSGQTIAFEIIEGPHNGTYGTGTTDSKGNAIWSYVGTTVGTDTIVATGYDQSSIYVYETWQQSSLTVNLTPVTATNPVGTEHTINATVKNSSGPLTNVKVNFSVISGPNSPLAGSGVTNSKGQVTFVYTGSGGIGIDKIQASVAANGNITYSNTIQKEWISSGDILAYYIGLNLYPDVVETADLLKAADDWRDNIVPPGFSVSLTTPQLLTLADEWRVS